MKKTLLGLLAIVGSAVMLACAGTLTTPTDSLLSESEDVVVFQAVSASELLTSALDSTALLSQKLALTVDETAGSTRKQGGTTTESDEPIVAEDIDVLDQYLSMMEQFLGADNGLSVTVVASDLPDYANKVVFVTRDLLGMDVTYTLYFNEVLYEEPIDDSVDDTTTTTTAVPEETTTEEPTTEEPVTTEEPTTTAPLGFGTTDRDREREFHDEEDDEILYVLDGILIVGDLTYNVEGKKVLEDEEEIFILYSYIDHDNFVKVRYLTDLEDGKQKFFYEVKVDGVITNKSKVMVGTDPEDGALMAKLEFTEGEATGKYQFKIETVENVTNIKIKYETESAEGEEESGMIFITATYDPATDTTVYEYSLRPENGHHQGSVERDHEDHHGHGDHSGDDDSEDESEDESEDDGDTTTTEEPEVYQG